MKLGDVVHDCRDRTDEIGVVVIAGTIYEQYENRWIEDVYVLFPSGRKRFRDPDSLEVVLPHDL